MENNLSDQMSCKEVNKVDDINVKHDQAQNTAQPLIIGNLNAGNLFASSLGGTENSMLIPPNMMGLPVTVNNNQVIGILPVFIQGSNLPSHSKFAPSSSTNNFESVQMAPSNNGLGSGSKECNDIGTKTFPLTTNASISNEQAKLTSSDTIILSSPAPNLTSINTLPILKSSLETSVNDSVTPTLGSQQKHSSVQSAFNLLTNLSNRSIALESIPSSSLFKPDQREENGPSREASIESQNITNCFQPNMSFILKNIEMSLRRNQTLNKPHNDRNVTNETDTIRLQVDQAINEGNGVEADEAFNQADKKQSSLTRDETLILPSSSMPCQSHNQHMFGTSDTDTIILSNYNGPLVANTSAKQLDTTSIETGNSGNFNINTFVSESGIVGPTSKLSFSSIPSLTLTDSIVDGSTNTALLCDLISQPTESNLSPIRYLTLDQFFSSANSNVIASMQKSLQASSSSVSQSNSSNLSVKGTQTDWILGNASVQFKPIRVSDPAENEEKSVDGNIPSSLLLDDEVETAPFVIEDQQLSSSVLNLVAQNQPILETEMATQDHNMDKRNNEVEETRDNELPFQCSTCKKEFSSKEDLQKHEMSHKKVLKCDLCTSTFTRLGNYKRHRKIHNLKPESQNVFTCTQCGREFLQRCDLKRHMIIHTNQYPYHCEKCGKGYIRRSDLVVHIRFHNKEKVFNCTLCDKSYFQSGDLSRHVRRAHKPHTELTCGHCNRKYACETTLIRHMKVVHKDIILNTVGQIKQVE